MSGSPLSHALLLLVSEVSTILNFSSGEDSDSEFESLESELSSTSSTPKTTTSSGSLFRAQSMSSSRLDSSNENELRTAGDVLADVLAGASAKIEVTRDSIDERDDSDELVDR